MGSGKQEGGEEGVEIFLGVAAEPQRGVADARLSTWCAPRCLTAETSTASPIRPSATPT